MDSGVCDNKDRMDVDCDSGTTFDEANNQQMDGINDEELADSAFGKSIQKKVHIAASVKEPITTVRKPKGNQTTLKEDTRRDTLVKLKKNVSGVLLSRIGPSTSSSIYSEDIRQIISSVFAVDKTAMILPHNKNHLQALNQKQFESMEEADYATFFDIQIEQWGYKREDKWRTIMSFYVASDTVEPNLKMLRANSSMDTTLRELSFRMSTHILHESADEAIGFLLGKSQQFTWRDEIVERIQKHLQHSELLDQIDITDPKSSPNLIPLAAKLRSIKDSGISADVITIFSGKKDSKKVFSLLEKYPFQDVDIVPYSIKRTHPQAWTQRIQIHNIQTNDSRAVKVYRVNDQVREALARNLRLDQEARTRVLDLARIKSTSDSNTLYIQCNKADKQWVTNWISTQIPVICNLLNLEEDSFPYIDEESMLPGSQSMRTRGSNTTTNTPPPTRFQHILNDPRYTPANKDGASSSSRRSGWIPKAIITGPRPATASAARSYAKVTTTKSGESNSGSTLSSPNRSTTSTIKTQREAELEEELSVARSQLSDTQQKLMETNEQLKETQKAHDNLRSLLEESIHNMQTQLQAQREEMEESLNRRLAEQWQQFQSHIVWQNADPMTTPQHPRKRQDTRNTPYATYGMPMQPPPYPIPHFYNPVQQYHLNPPPIHRAMEDYHATSPFYSQGQMEQTEDTEWNTATDQLQETSQEDASAAQN